MITDRQLYSLCLEGSQMKSFSLFKKTVGLIIQAVLVMAVSGGAAAVWAATPAISAGTSHTLVLRSDGTLWASGSNQTGQLGDGSGQNRSSAVQVANGGWSKISAGFNHSLAVKADGSLWSWGSNQFGQVGDGSGVDKLAPVRIGTDNDWVNVSASGSSSFALKGDGTLWSWGHNLAGLLGNGNTVDQPAPVQVLNPGASRYVAVSTGGEHTLALQADGTLWVWGFNLYGQLGNGNVADSSVPLQLGSGTSWKAVSAGGTHSIALKADGTLWSWGRNNFGQLGNGSTDLVAHSAPVQIGTASDWVAISAGELHSIALKRSGLISSWGINLNGRLGDGTLVAKTVPTSITNPVQFNNIVGISAGGAHSLALLANGDIYAWGDNGVGQFGNGAVLPSTLPLLVGADSVSWIKSEPGNAFTVALRSNGSLWAWGDNAFGQLGDGTLVTPRNTAAEVAGAAKNWLASASGLSHTIAVRANGTLWAWGDNSSGQLGDAAIVDNTTPQQISVTQPASASNNWNMVAAGDFHTLALKADGTLWAWGDNAFGQLGIGTADPGKGLPTQVVTSNPGNFDRNWKSVAAGGSHSIGLQADGTLWAWGDNGSGQLGDPFLVGSVNAPSQIVNLTPPTPGYNSSWVAVTAGLGHSIALQSDGTLWAWGSNFTGQLGNGDATLPNPPDQTSPVSVINAGGAPYVGVAAGDSFSVARRTDGSLWSWGSNTAGQLGIGASDPDPFNPVPHPTPLREVTAAADWTSVSVGGQHAVAIKTSGILDAWGDNSFGQLGDGTFAAKNSPAALLESNITLPAAIAFDLTTVSVGPFPTKALVIGNTGNGMLTVNSIAITGIDNSMFTLDLATCGASLPFNLAVGNSCTATVTFTPTSAGTKSAILTVNSNAPLKPSAIVSLTGTANLPIIVNASVDPVSPLNSGTIAPVGAVPVAPGGSQTFVLTANPGYSILDVVVDGISRGASASYTFSNVQATHTIVARFASTLSITASAGVGGTMSPIGTVKLNVNDNKTFIITPDFGYAIDDVTVVAMVEALDGNGNGTGVFNPVTTHLGAVTSFTFHNVRVNGSSISASFIPTNIRTWNWRNPLPHGVTLKSVETDGAGNYAAVGEFGIVMTSANGVDWAVQQSGTMNLNGVAIGAGRYVAVGNGGRILLSIDGGATWNEQSSGTASHLNCVTFNGTVFVAVGNSQINENPPYVPKITVLTSPDGVTWTDRSPLLAINETLDLFDIATGAGGKLAAVGAGGVIFTSADNGVTWTRIPDDLVNRAGNINSVTYGNSTFVAVGDFGQVTTSSDNGVTWNPVSVFSVADLYGVTYGTIGGAGNPLAIFVAVGSDGEVLTSENLGANWSNQYTGLANNGGGPVLHTAVIGLDKSALPYVPQLLVAGERGNILTSLDSVSWTSRSKSVTGATLRGVARGNGTFVAVGGEPATISGPASAAIVTSLDNGITWVNQTLPAGIQNLTAAAYGNGIFVAVGRSSYNAAVNPSGKATILTSPDGIVWTSRSSGSFLGLNGITFANGKFIAVGDYNQSGGSLPEGAAILTSTDGISWTFVQKITNTGWPLNSIAFGNNSYVAAGELGALLVSADGVIWNEVISPVINGYDMTSVVYGSGVFRAVGIGNESFVSSDNGAVWTSELLPVPATLTNKFQGLIHFNGQFVAVGNDDFILSKDMPAGNWVVNTGADYINNSLYGIAVGNGTLVAVGSNGTILQSNLLVPPAPQIVLNPTLLDFANGLAGATYKQTITVTNKGLANLVIGSITPPTGAFSLSSDTCSSATLGLLQTCTLEVTYAPVAAGSSGSVLIIPSNGESAATINVPMTGTAAASFSLTVTTSGAGAGAVTAAPAGYPVLNCISGSGLNCTAFYPVGTLVSIIATPNDWKAPGTISGACSATGTCTTTLSAARNADVAFNTALKVRVTPGALLDYPAIQDAYAAAASGATIKAQNYLFFENLLLDRAVPVSLIGGWNGAYTVNTGGYTTVTGSLTVGKGSVVVDKLIIR